MTAPSILISLVFIVDDLIFRPVSLTSPHHPMMSLLKMDDFLQAAERLVSLPVIDSRNLTMLAPILNSTLNESPQSPSTRNSMTMLSS